MRRWHTWLFIACLTLWGGGFALRPIVVASDVDRGPTRCRPEAGHFASVGIAEECESDGESLLAATLRSVQFTDHAACGGRISFHRTWSDEVRLRESLNRPTGPVLVGLVELLI